MSMKVLLVLIFCICYLTSLYSQDSSCIRVQFLYGSKPQKKYKHTEKKWFGGILGGHVGIEGDSGRFYSFEIVGKNKIFNGKADNSAFKLATEEEFWNVMKTKEDSLKKATIIIPITGKQKQKFDSITSAYLNEVPYCYAVFGMRCASSTYEILAQLGILPQYSHFKTYMKIFYPRRLRKRLLARAEKYNWVVIQKEGTPKRKWEKDV